jgi:predicted TIM-barrel fold metal-dependent hydrolase
LQSTNIEDLLRRLGQDRKIFEIYCRYGKFKSLSALAAKHSDTVIVLEHLGLPPVSSAEGMSAYWEALTALAKHPNVVLKVSGIGLITQHDPSIDVVPVLQRAVETFGSSRSMFGSDFPIGRHKMSYKELLQIVTKALQTFSADERADVMGRTACRIYSIHAEGASE